MIKISLRYCRDWGNPGFSSAPDQLAKDETGSLRREFVLSWHCTYTSVCWSEWSRNLAHLNSLCVNICHSGRRPHIGRTYSETPLRYCLCSTWYSSSKARGQRHPWFIQWLKGTRSVLLSGVYPFPFCENIFPLELTKPFLIAWKQPSIFLCYRLSRHTHSSPFSETAKRTKAWRSSCVPHHSVLLLLGCIHDSHLS